MKQTPKQFFSTQEGKLALALAAMVLCWTFFFIYISKTDVGDRWFPTQKKINLVRREIQNMTTSANPAKPSALQNARAQKAELDKLKEQDTAKKQTYWNADRDGQPETKLRNLVSEAAQRVEANVQNLGSVRMSTINSELSYADLDFTVVDEYDKIIRLIAEIEKIKPRLSWRSADIRVENARARAVTAANRQNGTTTTTTTPAQMFRTTMRVRVIKYSPAGNAASAKTAASTATSTKTSATTKTTTTSAATSSPATAKPAQSQPEQAQPAQAAAQPEQAAAGDTPAQKEPAATATTNKENEK